MQKPSNKISAVAVSAFVSTILVWILAQVGVDLPPEVSAAVTGLIAAVVGYFVPNAE